MAHFLSPLLKSDRPAQFHLVNQTTGAIVATTLIPAFDSATRRTGLLKHTSLPAGTAMIIAPCSSIHTFFMKFAIDVAFVSRDGRVIKLRRSMPAWRISASFGAFAAIEMAAAQPEGHLAEGSTLVLQRHDGSST